MSDVGLLVVSVKPSFDEDDEDVDTKVFSLLKISFFSSSASTILSSPTTIVGFSNMSKLSVELMSVG